jgi:hypothetical protein
MIRHAYYGLRLVTVSCPGKMGLVNEAPSGIVLTHEKNGLCLQNPYKPKLTSCNFPNKAYTPHRLNLIER